MCACSCCTRALGLPPELRWSPGGPPLSPLSVCVAEMPMTGYPAQRRSPPSSGCRAGARGGAAGAQPAAAGGQGAAGGAGAQAEREVSEGVAGLVDGWWVAGFELPGGWRGWRSAELVGGVRWLCHAGAPGRSRVRYGGSHACCPNPGRVASAASLAHMSSTLKRLSFTLTKVSRSQRSLFYNIFDLIYYSKPPLHS